MRRKKISLPIIAVGGLIYLIFSGAVQIRSGASLTPLVTENFTQEQLTGKLFISPGGTHQQIIDLLEETKYTLDIRGYQISDKELITVLINKAKNGVKVRIILENSMHGGKSDDFFAFYKKITGSGIEVISDEKLGTTYVHAKTFIIDQDRFIISTAKSTYPGFFGNREYRFVSKQKWYAQVLTNIFDHDRNNSQEGVSLPSNMWICPFNCRTELTTFIEEATTTIDIQAQYLEDPLLIKQLQQKAKEGVQLRLIFGKYQDDNLPTDLHPYIRIQSAPNVHAKNILIDNTKLYVGSMNLSTNAIENNREIGIVTEDKRVINTFIKQFTEDRNTKSTPYKYSKFSLKLE